MYTAARLMSFPRRHGAEYLLSLQMSTDISETRQGVSLSVMGYQIRKQRELSLSRIYTSFRTLSWRHHSVSFDDPKQAHPNMSMSTAS